MAVNTMDAAAAMDTKDAAEDIKDETTTSMDAAVVVDEATISDNATTPLIAGRMEAVAIAAKIA
jgi:hypothetical protein